MQPDEQDLDSPESGSTEHGSDDAKDVPDVSPEPEQSSADAEEQEENAETSLDQPSS